MYKTKEHRKCSIGHVGKSVRSGVSHLTSYIIAWLHLFYLEKLELFMLFHMRLHKSEAFAE